MVAADAPPPPPRLDADWYTELPLRWLALKAEAVLKLEMSSEAPAAGWSRERRLLAYWEKIMAVLGWYIEGCERGSAGRSIGMRAAQAARAKSRADSA